MTPLPDGSGVTAERSAPRTRTSWSFASSYQRTFSNNVLNELRIGDTQTHGRPDGGATERQRVGEPGPSWHSVRRAISEHAAHVPHRRVSAAWVAAEHRVARSARA